MDIHTPCDGYDIHPSSPWLALESNRLTAGKEKKERGKKMSENLSLAPITLLPVPWEACTFDQQSIYSAALLSSDDQIKQTVQASSLCRSSSSSERLWWVQSRGKQGNTHISRFQSLPC